MLLKPKRLRKGDVIGIVAPASPVFPEDKLDRAAQYLESLGYRVRFGKAVRKVHGYLAGSDKERARDINEMFANPKVNAIFCLRGGYGSSRLLHLIDYALVQKHPKIFVGFSDVTALSLAIFAKTGLITFSGPMLASDMTQPHPFAQEVLWQMLTSPRVFGELPNHLDHHRVGLRNGSSMGRLFGGNLSLLTILIGTEFFPNLKKSLLFFEDIGEEPYRIDRMLSQLKHADILAHLSGLIIGQLTDCDSDDEKPSLSMEDVLLHYLSFLPKPAPAFANLSYGHIPQKLTLPIGAKCRLHVSRKQSIIEIAETVVE